MNENLPAAQVTAQTDKKVRSFLYELAEGVTNYRSLHSLTEQIEHQYHGRVIIELLQNAHDALLFGSGPRAGRIDLVLKLDEGECGTLYVANDGACFSQSNFEKISQLGQSDKNPEKSIGNKGIGFRSVLEVTSSPEVYSRLTGDSTGFDGFCFKFDPAIIDELTGAVIGLLRGEPSRKLVDWDEQLIAKFRDSVGRSGEPWLRDEIRYLSPYLLPCSIDADSGSSTVKEFEQRGFATVIRLSLKSVEARKLVQDKLGELESETLLFLDKAKFLVVDDGKSRRELFRDPVPRPESRFNSSEVVIKEGASTIPQRYRLWTREIPVASAPAKVQEALKSLPGKWPQLQQAPVTLGVRLSDEPQQGRLSIFLPTLLDSGCGAQINAPFFGDMSRMHIDFSNLYNDYLLKAGAELALQVIAGELAGRGLDEARTIVDLLAAESFAQNAASTRWQAACREAASVKGIKIDEVSWFLSDKGWRPLQGIWTIPDRDGAVVITRDKLRANARFAAFVSGLDSRVKHLRAFAECYKVSISSLESDLANTVEALAQSLLLHPNTDWNGFWSDAQALFKGDSSPLVKKQVLLGNDEQLYASDETCTVFFNSRQVASDDEDIVGGIDSVPPSLTPHIAFLNERILPVAERSARQNPVRKFLESNLVKRFGVEDILRSVLLKRTPPLPLSLDDPRSPLCRDILLCGLRLMSRLVQSGKDKSLRLLGELPVPCRGGWSKLGESSFGAGWPDTQGDVLLKYLKGLPHTKGGDEQGRLLLPPTDERWSQEGHTHQNLLRLAGVFDGLRLFPITPKDWASIFQGSRGNFGIPSIAPPGVAASLWSQYREYVKADAEPNYQKWSSYEVQTLHIFPGFSVYEDLDNKTRLNLMSLALGSLGMWGNEWRTLDFKKTEGYTDNVRADSPLTFALRNWSWLGLEKGDCIEWFRPGERWHVPSAALAGRAWQFDHLSPLPRKLAQQLDGDSALMVALQALGMPHYDPETPSPSTRLLDDLAVAVERGDIAERNVFLGQVRSAWSTFQPESETRFPGLLIVRRGAGPLTAERPTPEQPIYLPTSSKSFAAVEQFDLPVLTIEISDARRLDEKFLKAYGAAIRMTSALKLVPMIQNAPWSGCAEDRLCESDLAHLIPLILTLAAFAGAQPKGISTKSFEKQMAMFRAAKIAWVSDLRAALFHGESKLADSTTDALWLNDKSVLLATERCRTEPGLLGEALAHLLDREDLELPIKLVLREFSSVDPDQESVGRALRLVKLPPERLDEVRNHWLGDLSQMIRMMLPLLAILRPDAESGRMVELQTDLELESFVNALQDQRFSAGDLLELCRASGDLFAFGKSAWERFGESLQLSAWNAVLAQRGEPCLLNREARAEFQRYLRTALSLLRSLLANILLRTASSQSYKVLQEELDGIACPPGFEMELWEVDFQHTLAVMLPYFQRCQASGAELEAIRLATSREDFDTRLRQAGVDLSLDPPETLRANREKLRRALGRLENIGLAWALVTRRADAASWEGRMEGYLAQLGHELDSGGYLKAWSEPEVFELLQKLPSDEGSEIFWKALSQAEDFRNLVAKLDLTDEALAQAQEKLKAFKEDVRRKGRLVEIGGREFDSAEDNLVRLFDHICLIFPDERLDALAAIDLRGPSLPEAVTLNSAKKGGQPRSAPKIKRTAKAKDTLVGLAGEIHAFRLLKSRYNAGPESWVSENGNIVFPADVPLGGRSDGRGCDFEIAFGSRTYFVEVKASEGEDLSFSLGSSEVILATEVARKGRQRKNVFYILHVTRALSEQPEFRLLPNPYDPRYQSLFLMDGADVRVRYRTAQKSDRLGL